MKLNSCSRIVALLALMLLAGSVKAQAPQLVNYQATLSDPNTGQPVADGDYTIVFSLYDVPVGGEAIWSESHDIPIENGLCSVTLGSRTVLEPAILQGTEKYLGIKVDDDEEMTPRQRLVSVAYSVLSTEADRLDGHDADDFATGAELSRTDGNPPNEGSNLVSWNNLTDVPSGFADGVDDALESVDGDAGPGALAHNTLDGAYDQGGSGAGRTIDADAGAVNIDGPDGLTVAGHVGIGTTTPTQDLVIGSDFGFANTGPALSLGTSEPFSSAVIWIGDDPLNYARLRWHRGGGIFRIETVNDGTQHFNTLALRSGKVGIGTDNPQEDLVIGDDIGGFDGKRLTVGNSSGISGINLGEDSDNRAAMSWIGSDNVLKFNTRSNGNQHNNNLVLKNGRVGIGTADPQENLVIGDDIGDFNGKRLTVGNSNGISGINLGEDSDNRAAMSWVGSDNVLKFNTRSNGNQHNNNLVLKNGRVGIGTADPQENLVIGDDIGDFNGKRLTVGNSSGISGINLGENSDNRAAMSWIGDDNVLKFNTRSNGNQHNNNLVLKNGRVGIGTANPNHELIVQGDDPAMQIRDDTTNNSANAARLELLERASGNFDGGAFLWWNGENNRFYIGTKESGSNTNVFVIDRGSNNVGIGTQNLNNTNAKLRVGGKLKVDDNTTTETLTITGGADLAEPFALSAASLPVDPGTVMIIDDNNPGTLKPSCRAYDKRVAGVVSGAGGVQPGVTLSQQKLLEGSTNIALTGQVYVKATAENGAIQPGDLLTSSDIPGHAMRASDFTRSHGSVIGKAMSSLESGDDLVLVLVNLQ